MRKRQLHGFIGNLIEYSGLPDNGGVDSGTSSV